MSLLWSCSVWESWQQFAADLRGTILAILNSCQSFGTVPMQRLASKIGKLRQFAQLFAAIPTLLVAIRHHATLPRAICRNRQNGPSHILQCIATVWYYLSLVETVLCYDSPNFGWMDGVEETQSRDTSQNYNKFSRWIEPFWECNLLVFILAIL